MKKNTYMLSSLLAAVLGVAALIAVLVRSFAPAVIIPALDMPNMVLLSLVALVLDYYVAPKSDRCYICIALFGALTFGLLPMAACFASGIEALKLAVLGGITFTATTWLFTTMEDRLSTGPAAKAAPIVSALGLYLAAQCLMGMF